MCLLNAVTWAIVVATMAGAADAQELSRAERGAPLVEVSHDDGKWTIRGQKQLVTLDESSLALRIEAGAAAWQLVPSAADDMVTKTGGKEIPIRLADAKKIAIEPYDTGFKTGVKITLGGWRAAKSQNDLQPLDLTLYLTIALEGQDEDLVFDIAAKEGDTVVRRLDWPTALDAADIDYTVLSNIRGVLKLGAREPDEQTRRQVQRMAGLHKRLALVEMRGHEFLTERSTAKSAQPLRMARR
jgi:hypothetical protein